MMKIVRSHSGYLLLAAVPGWIIGIDVRTGTVVTASSALDRRRRAAASAITA